MRCYKCGQIIDDNASFCRYCGTDQGSGATTVLDAANNPFAPQADYLENTIVEPAAPAVPAAEFNPDSWMNIQNVPQPVFQSEPAPVFQSAPQPVYQPEPQPAYIPEPAPQPAYIPEPAPVYQPAAQPAYQAQYNSAPVYSDNSSRPLLQLPTRRGLVKMIFLPLITLGIYGMVIWSRIVTELNIVASRHDGRRTMPYFAMNMLAPITLGIYPLIWIHGFCDRIGEELRRRKIAYEFGASTFWLWNVLGSLIIVGPFIYMHKLMKAMNLINADFNEHG